MAERRQHTIHFALTRGPAPGADWRLEYSEVDGERRSKWNQRADVLAVAAVFALLNLRAGRTVTKVGGKGAPDDELKLARKVRNAHTGYDRTDVEKRIVWFGELLGECTKLLDAFGEPPVVDFNQQEVSPGDVRLRFTLDGKEMTDADLARFLEERFNVKETVSRPFTADVESRSAGVRFGRFGEVRVHVLAGGGGPKDVPIRLKREHVHLKYENVPKELPPDLERTRKKLLAELAERARRNVAPLEDNPLVYLRKLGFLVENNNELEVTFGPSSYFRLAPFMYKLDTRLEGSGKTIREAYFLDPSNYGTPVQSAVSVELNVLCDGGRKIVFMQRGDNVAVASGFLSEAVSGAVNRDMDWDKRARCPSPFLAAVREAKEELNLDISPEQVAFHHVTLGLEDPSVCFHGEVRVSEGEGAVMDASHNAAHKEGKTFYAVRFDPVHVSNFLQEHELTDTSKFSVISSLTSEFGWRRVLEVF